METFAAPKAFEDNLDFASQRRRCLAGLTADMIDAPIRPLVHKLNGLGNCFTLQCCYGHFTYAGRTDPQNLKPLPPEAVSGPITYRIAYLALCIDNSPLGERLFATFARIPALAPDDIQFGSPDWFWRRQVNTYALQVEPRRFKYQDRAVLGYDEALRIEALRAKLFDRLMQVVENDL